MSQPFKFSNHYIEKLVQSNAEWDQDDGLADAFAKIRDLFHKREKQIEKYIESDLEHNFIRPIFNILGHYYGIQGLDEDLIIRSKMNEMKRAAKRPADFLWRLQRLPGVLTLSP